MVLTFMAVQSGAFSDMATKVSLSSQRRIEVAINFGAGALEPAGTAPAESLIHGLRVTGWLYCAEPVSSVADGAGGGSTVIVIVE
jgi:hypothetical protein